MVSLKKAMLACVVAGGVLSQGVAAEKDGAFVGFELGANNVKFKQTLDYAMQGNKISGDIKADNLMPSIAIKGGYKLFFNAERSFGARFYGQVGVGHGRLENVKYSNSLQSVVQAAYQGNPNATNSVFTGTNDTYYTTFIDYFVGADLLYNFIQQESAIYGVYLGVGVGGVTWAANGKEYEVSNGERSYTNFAANANFGLRLLIEESHEIDLGVRTYFPRSRLFKASNGTSPLIPEQMRTLATVDDTKTFHYRPFSVLLSYTHSF